MKSNVMSIRDTRLRACLILTSVTLVLFIFNFDAIFFRETAQHIDSQQDYVAFHGAGRAAISGFDQNLYDYGVFSDFLGRETTLLWLYPPHMLALLAPLGALDYATAKFALIVVCLTCAFTMFRLASSHRVGWLGLLSPTNYVALLIGQISAVFGVLLTSGLVLAHKRPYLAGVSLGLLTVKPQYGLLVATLLLFERAWRTILVGGVVLCILLGLSLWAYGSCQWAWFFESLSGGTHVAYLESSGHSGRYTFAEALRTIGLPELPTIVLYSPLLGLAIAGQWIMHLRASRELTISYTLVATAAINPYIFVYDYFIVHAGLVLAMYQLPKLRGVAAYCLIALWFAPLLPWTPLASFAPAIAWPLVAISCAIIFLVGIGEDKYIRADEPIDSDGITVS